MPVSASELLDDLACENHNATLRAESITLAKAFNQQA